ncbi:MAG: hypothetical protein WC595_03465 [Candidatus Nanoarchaeia archaeon]
MRFYYAARFSKKETIQQGYEKIRERGHTITSDWTTHKSIKPYIGNQEMSRHYADEDVKGVEDADVFVLETDEEGGVGSSAELGAAIALNRIKGLPLVYVIGSFNVKEMFYFQSSVNRRENLETVLDEVDEYQSRRMQSPYLLP